MIGAYGVPCGEAPDAHERARDVEAAQKAPDTTGPQVQIYAPG